MIWYQKESVEINDKNSYIYACSHMTLFLIVRFCLLNWHTRILWNYETTCLACLKLSNCVVQTVLILNLDLLMYLPVDIFSSKANAFFSMHWMPERKVNLVQLNTMVDDAFYWAKLIFIQIATFNHYCSHISNKRKIPILLLNLI